MLHFTNGTEIKLNRLSYKIKYLKIFMAHNVDSTYSNYKYILNLREMLFNKITRI